MSFLVAGLFTGTATRVSAAPVPRLDIISRFEITGALPNQPNRFRLPCAIAISPVDGRVFVSDTNPGAPGNRIVSFPNFMAMSTTVQPDMVIGIPGPMPPGDSSDVTKDPEALAFDAAGDLYVADTTGHRVMIFRAPFQSNMAASVVLGQSKFSWNELSANRGGGISAGGMNNPRGLAIDSNGNLWLADDYNKRVLRFDRGTGFKNGQNAALILGNTQNAGSAQAINFNFDAPKALVLDSANNLFVSDYSRSSIVRFAPPYTTGVSIYSGGNPIDMAITPYGDLYATVHNAPQGGARLLRWQNAATANPLVLDAAMPATNPLSAPLSQLGSEPLGVGFDAKTNRLLVADYGQGRILPFAFYSQTTRSSLLQGTTKDVAKELQARLNAAGATPPLVVDGIIGPKTKAAIKDFQQKHGLKVDGILGPQTWAAL